MPEHLVAPQFMGISTVAHSVQSQNWVSLGLPDGAQPGNILLAYIGFETPFATGSTPPPVTPPAGWTLARRINHGVSASLSVYWHVAKSGEDGFSWSTNQRFTASTSWISAYSGVDTHSPIDAEAGQGINAPGASVSTPSITTSQANEMLVASYLAMSAITNTTWTAPAGMTQRANLVTVSYSTSTDDAIQAAAGASGAKTVTASQSLSWAISHLLALRPARQ